MIDSVLGDRYRIQSKLGEGGMGAVFLAQDQRLESPVVIKVPHRSMLHEEGFKERFQREIRSLVKLSHPHIVSIIDVGEDRELPYAVMQHLGGGSLADDRTRLMSEGVEQRGLALGRWLPQIATALDFIHSKGFIHRDIKPANILFDEYDHAFLSDFGIAKVVAQQEEQKRQMSLTGTGIALGTPEYMAPELCDGSTITERVDQYALAITVYEMLAGECPLIGTTPLNTIVMHKTHQAKPLQQAVPGVSAALSAAVARAMDKSPHKRFDNCMAFANAVGEALAGGDKAAAPGAATPRSTSSADSNRQREAQGRGSQNANNVPEVSASNRAYPPADQSAAANPAFNPSSPKEAAPGSARPSSGIRKLAPKSPTSDSFSQPPAGQHQSPPIASIHGANSAPSSSGESVQRGAGSRSVTCVNCGSVTTVPASRAAQVRFPCPKCHASLIVDDQSQQSSTPVHQNATDFPAAFAPSPAIQLDAKNGTQPETFVRKTKGVFGVAIATVAVASLRALLHFSLGSYMFAEAMRLIPEWSSQFLVIALWASNATILLVADRFLIGFWVYGCWRDLPEAQRTVSPGIAAGFLAIPIFSWLWMFKVIPGYSDQAAQTIKRLDGTARLMLTGQTLGLMFGGATLFAWAALVAFLVFAFLNFPAVLVDIIFYAVFLSSSARAVFVALWVMFSQQARLRINRLWTEQPPPFQPL